MNGGPANKYQELVQGLMAEGHSIEDAVSIVKGMIPGIRNTQQPAPPEPWPPMGSADPGLVQGEVQGKSARRLAVEQAMAEGAQVDTSAFPIGTPLRPSPQDDQTPGYGVVGPEDVGIENPDGMISSYKVTPMPPDDGITASTPTQPELDAMPPAQVITESSPPPVTGSVAGEGTISESDDVETAIKKAAQIYGIDPSLLRSIAKHESGFNPSAKAVTDKEESYGLFQFNVKNIKDPAEKKAAIEEALDPRRAIVKAAGRVAADLKELGGDQRLLLASWQLGKPRVKALYNKYGADAAYERLGKYWTNKEKKTKTVKQSVDERLTFAENDTRQLNVQTLPPGYVKGQVMARTGEGYPGDVAAEQDQAQELPPEEAIAKFGEPPPAPAAPLGKYQPPAGKQPPSYFDVLNAQVSGAMDEWTAKSKEAYDKYNTAAGKTQEEISRLENQIATEVDQHVKSKVDPRRYFKNIGLAGNIFKALGASIGAVASSLSGGQIPNQVLASIEKGIDQDIQLQLEEIKREGSRIDASKNLLASQYKKLGNLRAAMESTRGIITEGLRAKFMGAQLLMKGIPTAGDDGRKPPGEAERKEIRDTMATVDGFNALRKGLEGLDYSRLSSFWSKMSGDVSDESIQDILTETLGLKRWRLLTGDARSERDVVQAFKSVKPRFIFGVVPPSKEAIMKQLNAVYKDSYTNAVSRIKTMNDYVKVEPTLAKLKQLGTADRVRSGGTGVKAQ